MFALRYEVITQKYLTPDTINAMILISGQAAKKRAIGRT